MSQDELSKAIINILKKEMGAIKDILPPDLLLNLQKVIGPEVEKLIEKNGYVSKSKYTANDFLHFSGFCFRETRWMISQFLNFVSGICQ